MVSIALLILFIRGVPIWSTLEQLAASAGLSLKREAAFFLTYSLVQGLTVNKRFRLFVVGKQEYFAKKRWYSQVGGVCILILVAIFLTFGLNVILMGNDQTSLETSLALLVMVLQDTCSKYLIQMCESEAPREAQ